MKNPQREEIRSPSQKFADREGKRAAQTLPGDGGQLACKKEKGAGMIAGMLVSVVADPLRDGAG